jgi:hypothetical protein
MKVLDESIEDMEMAETQEQRQRDTTAKGT